MDDSEDKVKSALVLKIINFGWMDGRRWDQVQKCTRGCIKIPWDGVNIWGCAKVYFEAV